MNTESHDALSNAQRILQDDFPEVDAVRLSRVQARIGSDIASERPKWFLWGALTSGACAAAALLLFVQSSDTFDAPTRHSVEQGVAVWQTETTEPPRWVHTMTNGGAPLVSGDLRFEIDRLANPDPFVISTDQAQLSIRQADFVLAATPRLTRVSVEAGRVQVRASRDAAWSEVSAGKSWERRHAPKTSNHEAQSARAPVPQHEAGDGPAVATASPRASGASKDSVSESRAKARSAANAGARPAAKSNKDREAGSATDTEETPPIARREAVRKAPDADADAAEPARAVPAPPKVSRVSLLAWMSAADKARREGRLADAATSYQRVAKAPDLAGLQEEASLRWAETARHLGRQREALGALSAQSGGLALLPERIALQSRLHLELGELTKAERLIIGRAPRPLALVVSEVAFAVAEKLGPGKRAVELCQLVRASEASTPSLKDRARALEAKTQSQKENDR